LIIKLYIYKKYCKKYCKMYTNVYVYTFYVYTTSSAIVLSVVKICSIHNVNSKLAVKVQSTNRITLKISKKGHTSSVHLLH